MSVYTDDQLNIFNTLDGSEGGRFVQRITREEAIPFLLEIHYARRVPNITDAFGLYIDGTLAGVVTYGIPASRPLCVGLAGKENADRIKELNRLVLKPDAPGKNNASFFGLA